MKKNCSKVIYSTKEFAEQDLKKIKSKSKRADVPKRVYLCRSCNGWHLTKIPKSNDALSIELQNKVTEISRLKELIKGQQSKLIKNKATILRLKNEITNVRNNRDEWKFRAKRLMLNKNIENNGN